jgi:hypothetical protein
MRPTTRLLATGGGLLIGMGAFAGAVDAQRERAQFACPSDLNTQPLGKVYGKNRGSAFCNDGATAMVKIAGRPALTLKGGVCWRNKTSLEIGIGTLVANAPVKSDPPGLLLTDVKPGDVVGDTLDLSQGKYGWTGPVTVKLAGKKGTFTSTAAGTAVNGKLTGSFVCKRILNAPNQ